MRGKKFLVGTVAMSLALAVALGGVLVHNNVKSKASSQNESITKSVLQELCEEEMVDDVAAMNETNDKSEETVEDVDDMKEINDIPEETGGIDVSKIKINWLKVFKAGVDYTSNNFYQVKPEEVWYKSNFFANRKGSFKFNKFDWKKGKKTSGSYVEVPVLDYNSTVGSKRLIRSIYARASKRGTSKSKYIEVVYIERDRKTHKIVKHKELGQIKNQGEIEHRIINKKSSKYPNLCSIVYIYTDSNTWDLEVACEDFRWANNEGNIYVQ